MTIYNVKSTNKSKLPIKVPEGEIVNDLAMKLFGRKKLAYGQDLNENLLRLLESFACPADPLDINLPHLTQASDNMFSVATDGQLWFNKTNTTLYVYGNGVWIPQRSFGDIAANWGVISHGEQIPLPISPSGRTYTYAECSWIVAPYGYPNAIDFMVCNAGSNGIVTMQYSLENDASLIGGYANYLIVGIPGNVNLGAVAPGVSVTPTPTVTQTPTPTKSPTPTPSATKNPTPTPTPTKSITPTPTTSLVVSETVTPTPTIGSSPTPTPTESVTPSVTPSDSVTPTPTTSIGAIASPTPTPTPTISLTPSVTSSPAPAFGMVVTQGDGSQYGSGLVLTAENVQCAGFCGPGLGFAPSTNTTINKLGITISGGMAPYTVIVDTWAVDSASTNTMFGETMSATGNFSGSDVMDNPLVGPTWTWSGGTDGSGRIILDAIGKCAYADRSVTGSAVIRASDNLGQIVTFSFGWSLSRHASADNGCSLTP
jgi:hypothetical protein